MGGIYREFVAQVAEVSVGEDGRARVERVRCAADPGEVVHPDGLAAQLESGIIYGLTAALYGEITIDKGRVVEKNFGDYPMIRLADAPAIEVQIVASGARTGGAGEPGTPPTAAALANAVFAATGKRIRSLPCAALTCTSRSRRSRSSAEPPSLHHRRVARSRCPRARRRPRGGRRRERR
jgi:isoquinoline 1-oxidoreductase beta subunit